MGLFKRRPDPLTVAMSIVEQFASGDPGAVQRGIDMLESVSPGDFLVGLASLGQSVSSQWKPDQVELIRSEFAAADGSPGVQQAAREVGPLLLITPDLNKATQAIKDALHDVVDNRAEVVNLVLIEVASAVGRIMNKLDIKLGWK
jgi:hypothetical protein